MKNCLPKLALLITAILWGTSLTFVHKAVVVFEPNFIIAARFIVATAVLCLIFFKSFITLSKYSIYAGVILGVVLLAGYVLQTYSVRYALPGRAGFLAATYCVMVPFVHWILDKQKPNIYNIIAAVLCTLGVFFISISSGEKDAISEIPKEGELFGDFLSLASAVLFALHIVLISKFTKKEDPIKLTITQFIAAGILACIITLLLEDNQNIIENIKIHGMVPVYEVLYLGVFCTAGALTLQNIAQKHTDPNSTAIILGLESVFSVIFPVMLNIEVITLESFIGFCLIFAAIIISETKLSFLKIKSKKE